MVMNLQMKFKQRLGVAAIFSLGIFVIISSSRSHEEISCMINAYGHVVIRAIYSSRNETMLTCTVSMVETGVAIIGACLPGMPQELYKLETLLI